MTGQTGRLLRRGACLMAAAVAVGGLTASPGTASAAPAAPARGGGSPPVTEQVPVAYDCFVTYQGGDTVVQYGLTFDVTAPSSVRRFRPFTVTLDTPPITPNPTLQADVRDVEMTFRLPEGTLLLMHDLEGGSGLGGSVQQVERDGDVVRLRATGPFPSATVFDLPALELLLLPFHTGAAQVTEGGTSFEDPSFSWVRNSLSPGDPPGTLRPFDCQPPEGVVFSDTEVTAY